MKAAGWSGAVAGLGLLLAIPLALAPRPDGATAAPQLTIITPHNERIRFEFARGFERWHEASYGTPVRVAWLVPGGTSTIQRMLEAQFEAARSAGRDPGGSADLLFGGGSWVHEWLSRPTSGGGPSITVAVDFDDAWLLERYGATEIGGVPLHDPAKHWFGAALSTFGIVYNRDALAELGRPPPRGWRDLCDPALAGRVALADPAASGSINTAFETILRRHGWREGWRVLRRAGANARSLSGSAVRAPLDVGAGDAAAGICIDFYARYEAEALADNGYGERLGYVDPPGETTIDPDPVSMLRGAPQPLLARRFIEFCLSEPGQALWQFRAGDESGLGPTRFQLRRLPAARTMYERHLDRFTDPVDPWTLAGEPLAPQPLLRSFVPLLFGAMVIDNRDLLGAAWRAITAATDEDSRREEMLRLFDAMPPGTGPDGERIPLDDDAGLEQVAAGWRTPALWPADADPATLARQRYAAFFRDNYRAILRLARGE